MIAFPSRWAAGHGDKRVTSRALVAPAVAFGVVVLALLLVRLILDPIATHETRKALDKLHGYTGDFERVHLTLFGPGYFITHLKLTPTDSAAANSGVRPTEPMFYVRRAHLAVDWRELLHARIAASLRLDHPKIVIAPGKAGTKKAPAAPPDLAAQLTDITAIKVDRIEVIDGELVFRENADKPKPELWVHDLELVGENLATRESLTKARPATLSGHAMVGRSGTLDLFVSADLFARPLSFAGQVSLKGFKTNELYAFLEPKTHLQASEGSIDVSAEFLSRNGILKGGVKPVLKNVTVRPIEPGLWDRLKAWVADESVKLASDRVPGRNAVATIVPIEGRLTAPDIQLWPTILGVIRNAFVKGLAGGFENVPPATADEKQGALEQAKNALKKDEGPLKAQPVEGATTSAGAGK